MQILTASHWKLQRHKHGEQNDHSHYSFAMQHSKDAEDFHHNILTGEEMRAKGSVEVNVGLCKINFQLEREFKLKLSQVFNELL